jgi:hypothetical protein
MVAAIEACAYADAKVKVPRGTVLEDLPTMVRRSKVAFLLREKSGTLGILKALKSPNILRALFARLLFANESTCGVTESRTFPCGSGGSGRSLSVVGNGRSRELCEALELAPTTLQADHLRFFTSNHSKPVAATTNTVTTDHGVDVVGSSVVPDCS